MFVCTVCSLLVYAVSVPSVYQYICRDFVCVLFSVAGIRFELELCGLEDPGLESNRFTDH